MIGVPQRESDEVLGVQWELRGAVARTDQRLGHYDASVRAHVDGRVSPGDALQAAFRTSCRGAMGIAIPVGAHRPVVASSFVCPAGNTSAHSSAPRRAHEKLPSGQNARLRSGIEKETEGVTLLPTRHSAPQFPLHPYRSRQY